MPVCPHKNVVAGVWSITRLGFSSSFHERGRADVVITLTDRAPRKFVNGQVGHPFWMCCKTCGSLLHVSRYSRHPGLAQMAIPFS